MSQSKRPPQPQATHDKADGGPDSGRTVWLRKPQADRSPRVEQAAPAVAGPHTGTGEPAEPPFPDAGLSLLRSPQVYPRPQKRSKYAGRAHRTADPL